MKCNFFSSLMKTNKGHNRPKSPRALFLLHYHYSMSFNHYAKIKRILEDQKPGWYIKKINTPTKAQNFKGETITYPHYYRIYTKDHEPIKYCKFQQPQRLADILSVTTDSLPFLS